MSRAPGGTIRDWIDRRAREAGGTDAYLFTDGSASLTWGGLREESRRVAAGLAARDVRHGESVAIMLPNGRDALRAFFGAAYGGFRPTMINLVAGDSAIAYALEHSGARICLSDGRAPAGPRMAAVNEVACDGDPPAPPSADDDALLMYTSGTTGRPKGVLHGHASLLAGGWTTALAHGLAPRDRGLCVLPVYHINALCVSVMSTLVAGGSLCVAPRFSATSFWGDAGRHGVTWFSVVPTIVSHLLHGEAGPDAACRARLRFGRSASSALAPETHRAFEARFGVPLIETMGLTETAAQILSNPLPPGPRRIGSPGVAQGCEVAILGPEGGERPRGEDGEIAVRGPNLMKGYLRNPEATAEALRDGWLMTGDLGRMDADGYVFVTGRLKELIIKGGENIAPREVDEALYADPDVVEAAAFGRPCARYGERVEAAVALRDGAAATPESLLALCAKRLGAFKCPDRIHLMPELPKGPSGKIQRLKLAELLPA